MDPLTWAMLALMAASTGASAYAQHKTNKAQAQVMAEGRQRREAQDKRSEALALGTADAYASTPDKEKEEAAALAKQYGPSTATPTTSSAGTRFLDTAAPTGSAATIEETTKQIGQADARTARRGEADAKLRAFGDVMGSNAIIGGRNAQDIGQGASFVNSWQQNVMPALMQKAGLAGRDWATAADVMKLAAAVMTPFALTTSGSGAGLQAAQKGAAGAAHALKTAGAAHALKAGASAAPIWQGAAGAAAFPAGAAVAPGVGPWERYMQLFDPYGLKRGSNPIPQIPIQY